MEVKFTSSFEKDVKKTQNTKVLTELKQVIFTCQKVESITEIPNIKKMQGYKNNYRIWLAYTLVKYLAFL